MEYYNFSCGCRYPITKDLGPNKLPLLDFKYEDIKDCPIIWEIFEKGLTLGIFQLESNLGQKYCKELKPTTLKHLEALASILRPGCLNSKTSDGKSLTQQYCDRKNGKERIIYDIPALEPILNETYGVLTYQEQQISIAQIICGFTASDADSLRKSVGKKDNKLLLSLEEKFINGAEQVGKVTRDQAVKVFDWIKSAGRYSFNRCFSGRELIKRATRSKFHDHNDIFTIEEMYKIRNDISYAHLTKHNDLRKKWKLIGNYGKGLSLCKDGRVRPNIIVNIQPSGVRRVYKLTVENGATILVTDNHKFPTSQGEMTTSAIKLAINNGQSIELFMCGEYEKTTTKYNWSNFTKEERLERAKNKSVLYQTGEDNWAYTNGSYTDYMNAKATLPMICQNCGKTNCRLELHHVHRDRTRSKVEDLQRLCVSCHKKADYALGRVKRGEKGYPSFTCKVISVEFDCEEMTYDVTMDAPNHNLAVSSGIVACNSHASGYAIKALQEAYLKTHFPLAFYTAKMGSPRNSKTSEDVANLIYEARRFNIQTKLPDLRDLQPTFYHDNESIYFGLVDIKKFGGSSYTRLVQIISEHGEILANFFEFCMNAARYLTPSVVELLIKSGSCDFFKISRTQMLEEYRLVGQLTDPQKELLFRHYDAQKAGVFNAST